MAAYDVNYNDKRFTQVEADKKAAIKESDKTYDSMIQNSDKYYNQQIDAVNQYGDKQSQLQQEKTDFAIEQIEQQKEQARSDYMKEQSASYVDWQKQSNDYGSNAEKMADSGLAHTGYSESSQVSMYNTYQNRVATARESYNRAVLNYDNAIKDARLQNNSVLAEIAFNTLQKSLELGLQGFQYKNQLVLEKANAKRDIDNNYYNRYQNVLSQINHENSMAEQIRQYNESLAFQKEQFEWQKKKSSVSSGGGGGGNKGSTYKAKIEPAKKNTKTNGGTGSKVANSGAKAAALAKVSGVKTSSQARSLLKSLGINPGVQLIDSVTWNKAKRLGDGGSDVQNFDNYAAYAQAYCRGAINGKF